MIPMRKKLGLAGAALLAAIVLATVALTDFPKSIDGGILIGLAIAYAQAIISIAVMAAALKNKWFLWAWSGSFFFRLFVFSFCLYRKKN
jgi:hypothetical protein